MTRLVLLIAAHARCSAMGRGGPSVDDLSVMSSLLRGGRCPIGGPWECSGVPVRAAGSTMITYRCSDRNSDRRSWSHSKIAVI